jgi:hypothetical protein
MTKYNAQKFSYIDEIDKSKKIDEGLENLKMISILNLVLMWMTVIFEILTTPRYRPNPFGRYKYKILLKKVVYQTRKTFQSYITGINDIIKINL